MNRLFIAIPTDDPVQRQLAGIQERVNTGSTRVRWVPPAQLHLTLKFLGDIPDTRVATVAHAMTEASRQVEPFDLQLSILGCFPKQGPVRIIWAGNESASEPILRLYQELEGRLASLGYPPETRTFSQHFTLGRVKFDASHGTLRTTVESHTIAPVHLDVSELVLYQSLLGPKGPQYVALCKAPLSDD